MHTVTMDQKTYKPPTAKIAIRATLCLLGKSRLYKAGIGITRIARSVAICIEALENHRAFELRHDPGIVGSQKRATGMQFKNPLSTAHVPYVTRIPIMVQQMRRMHLDGKTRKYCIRIDAFAQRSAAL